MADFEFRADLAANKELVCSISRLLNAHGIPNLLWGELVFNLYGVPLQVSDFSFVIPDDLIDKARSVLETAKFPPCQTCPAIQPNRPAPPPMPTSTSSRKETQESGSESNSTESPICFGPPPTSQLALPTQKIRITCLPTTPGYQRSRRESFSAGCTPPITL
ncbi:uncharacterized protein NFIA_113200 [Aspergillus fischeri NRRL 181]|uniref:Uncharacterized protein n=1 Tax=Neosartorya fischeri (strain ATCC 1020 / DSM 3700 / CBS 544.65 / FGSC A1164 / JCM 1740 / NRRL 181 / WB 181) TaxID=331117 RepID=A1D8S9_NEOFI|nr:uncharacterized protein NFIA_113200 [Aspergillus fischeri NRRL 181]EAW20790.1 hypothetical protein NFIA_113200 [Aspergillus fischeri NRRL 181]KAG2002816.1 hypothetical protein GB937_009463 [Aspergillus fischeri]